MANKKIRKTSLSSSEKFALISVSNKTGIVDFARELISLGYTIISTGGTAKELAKADIKTIPPKDITHDPESFDGRMKTISFEIESGLLYDRKNPKHVKEAKKLHIKPIDIVVSNLYPFEETIKKKNISLDTAVENIDVGGPTMVRSAAKNFKNCLVVTNPHDYTEVLEKLQTNKDTQAFRQTLAAKAFDHLSFYDSQIAHFLRKDDFPEEIALSGRKSIALRYGENPHQKGSVYIHPNTNSPLKNLTRLAGRELSYINVTDMSAGIESVRAFNEIAAVVIKHNNPSGIATGKSPKEALLRAVEADPESAFGGVMVLNTEIDLPTAKNLSTFKKGNGILVDIIAAPLITQEALEYIKTVRKTTGVYTFGKIFKKRSHNMHLKFFDGGFIMQEWDSNDVDIKTWTIAGKVKPTKKQLLQMQFAWKAIGRIKSNTIIVVDSSLPMTRGIGSGQTSRVRATKIALEQAGKYTKGGILASDSFFPFDDSVTLASQKEIAAIIEQGGSVNDKLSIEAADKAGIPIVFTNERKFWH